MATGTDKRLLSHSYRETVREESQGSEEGGTGREEGEVSWKMTVTD